MIQAFPLRQHHRPSGADEPDAGATPWLLKFACTPDVAQARVCPAAIYDAQRQISVTLLGEPVIWAANTHTPTNPDGDPANPPPFDEGAKD